MRSKGVEDMARHVRGEATEKVVSTRSPMRRLQQRMFDALTAPLVNDYTVQMRRRTAAIQALVAYCGDKDPVTTKVVKAPVVAPRGAKPGPLAAGTDGGDQEVNARRVRRQGRTQVLYLCCEGRTARYGSRQLRQPLSAIFLGPARLPGTLFPPTWTRPGPRRDV